MGFPPGHKALAFAQPIAETTTVAPAKGHGRGKTQPADKTDIGLRGVPVIGHGSGAISLTAPGGELGNAARLEQAGRDLNEAARRIIRERTRYKQ